MSKQNNNQTPPLLTETTLTRRTFCNCMKSIGVMTVLGQTLVACAEDEKPDPGLSGPIVLTTSQITQLDDKGYLNVEGGGGKAMIFKNGNTYTAYTRVCPHEQGTVDAISPTNSQCQTHKGQYFDIFNNEAKGNGHETASNLARYDVTVGTDASNKKAISIMS